MKVELISEIIFRTGLLSLAAMVREKAVPAIPILAYHRVMDLPNEDAYVNDIELISASNSQFRRQIKWLSRKTTPITFKQLGDHVLDGQPLPKRPVIVTFDDGFNDNYDNAFPILREFGVPATFFVSTGYIDQDETFWFDWAANVLMTTQLSSIDIPVMGIDETLSDDPASRRDLCKKFLNGMKTLTLEQQTEALNSLEQTTGMTRTTPNDLGSRPLTSDEIAEMSDGGMEFGSHGVTHRMLAKLDEQEIRGELSESKSVLEEKTGKPVTSVSYPTGGPRAFDERVMRAAEDLGYHFGCSYKRGINVFGKLDRFALSRSAVERQVNHGWFASMVKLPGIF